MKLVCPICQAEYPLEAALNDVAARQAVVRAFELTELGGQLIRYVQLFKPAKHALSMTKLAKMLDELVPMVKAGQITRSGTIYAAPQAYWQQGIEAMLASRDKLSLPLKSHGYLLEIIAGYANKAAAKNEKKNEEGRKYGVFHAAGTDKKPLVLPQDEKVECEKQTANKTASAVEKPQKTKREAKLNLSDTLKKMTGKVK